MAEELPRPEPGQKLSVLFCCLGNICRSPMAEGAFRHTVEKLGYSDRFNRIDSCGTAGYHTGEPPDERTLQTLQENGIEFLHRARQVREADFKEFDYILAMDSANLRDLKLVAPKDGKAKVLMFGHFDGRNRREVVQDPYYGGNEGFKENFKQIQRFSKNFLKEVLGVQV